MYYVVVLTKIKHLVGAEHKTLYVSSSIRDELSPYASQAYRFTSKTEARDYALAHYSDCEPVILETR